MAQVVLDECLDEPVAVVVALLHARLDRLSRGAAGFDEQLRAQLPAQELIGVALVDQDGAVEAPSRAHQFEGIVGLPRFAIVTQIAREGFQSPRHLRGCDDRRKRGDGAVMLRMPQRERQRAMSAHRMAHDAATVDVGRKIGGDQRRQFVDNVRFHPEA